MKAFMCRGVKSYQTFSIKSLSNIFELEEKQVKKFISKMILKNQIDAHIDPSLGVIILEKTTSDIKELQHLSLQYVSKIESQIANNEKMLDFMVNPHKYASMQMQ